MDEAIASFHKALAINPDYAEALGNLGNALIKSGRLEEAATSFHKALAIKSDYAEAHSDLGVALQAMGKLGESVTSYQRAVSIKIDFAEAHFNLGNAFKELRRLDEAGASYHKALAINPDYAEAHSNLLMNTQYQTGITVALLRGPHIEWNERFGIPMRKGWQKHNNQQDTEKRLRIGFVSPDFGKHPVGYFLVRLLENKHQGETEFICYSDRNPDEMTDRIRDASDGWTDIRGMTDESLVKHIREDGIDILLDITGHTAKNMLLCFARKPAPLQVSWGIGYPTSTGLSAIDYLLTDIHHAPEKEDHLYSEKIIRMPDGVFCYDPPSHAPGVEPPPAERNGFITFGSFNSPAKINDATMEAWIKILDDVPDSRLFLKYKGIDDGGTRERLLSSLGMRGLDASRLILEGWSPHPELLGHYNDIDIALDTFPYSGGLTTCEALWMGVPVITVPGKTAAGRHALSHLSNIGLPELAAEDEAGYVELAVKFAGNLPRLASLCSGLRDRMAKSTLCDGAKFARHFTDEMRNIWRLWCGENGK